MSQEQQILNHLKNRGSLTPLDALKKFNCLRLASRIKDLRYEGFKITTIMVEEHDKRYARYVLKVPCQAK